MRGRPQECWGWGGRPSWGRPRPHDSPDPACRPIPWILGCGWLALAPPPPPAGGGGVQQGGGRLGPPPGPPAGPLGATPHLGRAPPLLADSASLAACGPALYPSGASAGEGQESSPMQGEGPWARPQENRTQARRAATSQGQPHLSGQGRQCSQPQGKVLMSSP